MITNISGKEIDWRFYKGSTVYRALAFDLTRQGREVETTLFHRTITARLRPNDPPVDLGGSSILFAVPPGKIFTLPVDLARLYEITEPGTYTLVLNRYGDYSTTAVRSNTVTLNIVALTPRRPAPNPPSAAAAPRRRNAGTGHGIRWGEWYPLSSSIG